MRVRIGIILFAVCVLLFISLAALVPETGPFKFDERVADVVSDITGNQGEDVWKAVTELGSPIVIVAAALVYTAWFGWRMRTAAVLWIPAGGAAAYVLNKCLKDWLDRERPAGAWGIEYDGASFPSGNAMLAMTVYGTILLSFLLYTKAGALAKGAAAIVGVAVIVCVGFSRLYFGVHYATDIVAGYAAGGAVMLASLYVMGLAFNRRQRI